MLGIALSPEFVNKPVFLLAEVLWFAIAGALFAAAFRSKLEWVRAGLGGLALSILAWHLLAVVPSWWLYFADTTLGWGGAGCVSLAHGADAIKCLKQTGRDIVVVAELGAASAGFVVAFLAYQRRFPKQLSSGEAKPDATGGYK